MFKIIPILMGVAFSYVAAVIFGKFGWCDAINYDAVANAAWIGLPVKMENTVFPILSNPDWGKIVSAIAIVFPLAFATIMEHVGDVSAISSTVKRNFFQNPGLHRTMLGDGLATCLASLFGAPANTTYGENTGVLSLSKVYDPRVIRIAACLAILVSFCPKFSAFIGTIPGATIGGVSFILYGMISAVGVRNLVESQVDLGKSRNMLIAALILVKIDFIHAFYLIHIITNMILKINIKFVISLARTSPSPRRLRRSRTPTASAESRSDRLFNH